MSKVQVQEHDYYFLKVQETVHSSKFETARHRHQELQASFKELDLIEVFISGFLQKWFIISPLFKLWGIRKFHSYFSICNNESKFKWPWWSVNGRFWVSVPSFSYDPVHASTLMIKVKRYNNALCRTSALIEKTFGFLNKEMSMFKFATHKPRGGSGLH